ncbi:phosphoribosylglycinamide formyltransferase [Paenibacillus larvae]
MNSYRIAVFASGRGSNFQAIADAVRKGTVQAELALLVCDRPSAPVVAKAEQAGVSVFAFRPKDYHTRADYEAALVQELKQREIDLVVLAGYMRLLTNTLVDAFYGRLINIHPSLLPAFPGVNGIGDALEYGVKWTGVTVHYVDGGMDTGPIIAQKAVEIRDDDTEETLAERIHQVEHKLLPWVIEQFQLNRVRLEGRKVKLDCCLPG